MLKVVNHNEPEYVQAFIDQIGDNLPNFRYFKRRPASIIQNHLFTCVWLDEATNTPVAYGHLDKEDNTVWLGIAVLPQAQGQYLGDFIMKLLVTEAKKHTKELFLTTDIDNIKGLNIFTKHGFKIVKKNKDYYTLKLKL